MLTSIEQLLCKVDFSTRINNLLTKLKIVTYWDLLLHLPLRYEDFTPVVVTDDLIGQKILLMGIVTSCKQHRKFFKATLLSSGKSINLLFFHYYDALLKKLTIDNEIIIYGQLQYSNFEYSIIHPELISNNNQYIGNLRPIYSLVKSLTQSKISTLINTTLQELSLVDYLPTTLLQSEKLLNINNTLNILHNPTKSQYNSSIFNVAIRRLKFDESLSQQIVIHMFNTIRYKVPTYSIEIVKAYIDSLVSQLPFQLTKSQQIVLQEICTDLKSGNQMRRLLHGDVGSGKTIIAILVILLVANNTYQVCFLSPTELLAEQNYIKLRQIITMMNLSLIAEYLVGSISDKLKKSLYSKISDGSLSIIVGTHALLQENVHFKNLALVVIDEQHRFGVAQRQKLFISQVSKPHLLMLSATPIPRSFAMVLYANIDKSEISELPHNRQINNYLIDNSMKRDSLFKYVENGVLKHKRQVYWVCPLIDKSEALHLTTIVDVNREIKVKLPTSIKVATLHGKMNATDKSTIMKEFLLHKIDILVATTVIEVGIDVSNASIMIIEHSDRMGLSQLHQLRGRIGRGSVHSDCFLLYTLPISEIGKKRLSIIKCYNDGFRIAYEDIRLRGPGSLLGNTQSGILNRILDYNTDLNIIKKTRNIIPKYFNKIVKLPDFISLWHTTQDDNIEIV